MTMAREKLEGTNYRFIDNLTNKDPKEKRQLAPLMNELYCKYQHPRFADGRLYANGKSLMRQLTLYGLDLRRRTVCMRKHGISY